MKKRDMKSVIKNNPSVNEKLFHDSCKMIEELRKNGVEASKYNLEPPFTRTNKTPTESVKNDPRSIRIR